MNVNSLSPGLNRSSKSSTYEMKMNCSPERDIVISKLKAQLFEYEQNEKNYYQLQSKYRNLQNDLQLLSEEKLRLEYDVRQKTDNANISIGELKKDNENILNDLNEKIVMNKKLYNDNNNLFRTLESRAAENSSLKEQVEEQEELIGQLSNEKSSIEREITSLEQTKEKNNANIYEMSDEIGNLKQTNNQQGNNIQSITERNKAIISEIDQQRFENKNLRGKLNSREENLASTHNQLEHANRAITKLNNDYKALERNYTVNQKELDANKNNCLKEIGVRQQLEQNNEELENILRERIEEIKTMGNENEAIKMNLIKLGEDKSKLDGEINQYRNHIQLLMDQNRLLAEELEFILQRDQKLLIMLNRNQKLSCVVEQNNMLIENSLDNLKQDLDNKKSYPQEERQYSNNDEEQ